MAENGRRIDVLRRTGPLLIAAGAQNVEVLSYRLPTDSDGELAALGTEVAPVGGSDWIRWTPYVEQTSEPDYFDAQTQPGTVPIPYLSRFPIGRGKLFRLLVSNDDPANDYRVNARAVIELS